MVSIIIPIHNVEKYIERCICSVIRQTYQDIECILVDDACEDSSMDICSNLLRMYDGPIEFKTIHLKKSEGPSGGRNAGTKVAKGKYIFYLDSDDEITDDCIEKLYSKTCIYTDVEIVQGGIWAEKNIAFYDISMYKEIEYVNDNLWVRKEFLKQKSNLPIVVWNKLILKDYLQYNNISFEPNLIHEDELWMFNVMKSLKKICFVKDITYKHYSVPGSIMTGLRIDYSNKCWYIVLDRIMDEITEPMIDEQIKKYLLFFLQKESYYKTIGSRIPLLKKILHKASGQLQIALIAYIFLDGNSLRMYLNQYCLTGKKEGLLRQIYYDFRSILRNKIKK